MAAIIYPYKAGSKSAKALAEALEIKRAKLVGSKFKGKQGDFIINWGCSKIPHKVLGDAIVVNDPESIVNATNKLKAFETMHRYGVLTPEFTTNKAIAQAWLDVGKTVVERHKLSGHSGEGIKIKGKGDVLETCKLYVKYVPKKSEWRIHIVMGKVVAVQRKARRRDVPDEQIDWKVRNHGNGFIFARNEGAKPPAQVIQQAEAAVAALSLDMGAVDVIYNKKNELAYVLEVNTACGLEGETVNDYARALSCIIKGEENG